MNLYTIDFETHAIINGSPYSPIPVGVSIKLNNNPSYYYAWGHPTNNNCSKDKAAQLLGHIWDLEDKIICHNSKFDLRVALEHFGLSVPDPSRIIDTMIMMYLIDPRESSLSLKPLTEKYCGMPPEQQDNLNKWLMTRRFKPGQDICKAPGDLVGIYAESDTDRTYILYQTLAPRIFSAPIIEGQQNIYDAFQREMRILPIVIDMEQRGINIAPNIGEIYNRENKAFNLMDMQIMAYSNGAKPGSMGMFYALQKRGLIYMSKVQYTEKTGKPRIGKDFIEDIISDPNLSSLLKNRSKKQKLVGTYIKPFYESAKLYKNKFYPYYNQTRSEGDFGTRTGRFSSNIQQLPKHNLEEDDFHARSVIVPSEGKIFVRRDFSGQELRVAAHYAEGAILKKYQDDPKTDIHAFVSAIIKEKTGLEVSRFFVKIINFLKLYGGGPDAMSRKYNVSIETARAFFRAYDEALPEFKQLMKDIEKLSKSGKKIRTWGGRSYDVEEAKDGRQFYYKLGNVLIQGSSADITKESMIRYWYHPDRKGELLMTVHDELVLECNPDDVDTEMKILKWAMDEIPGLDCPLVSDGSTGYNFSDLKEYIDD
jgi:DNA polymerase-1